MSTANIKLRYLACLNPDDTLFYRHDPEWDVQPADNIIMTKVRNDRGNAEVVEQQEKMCEQAKVKGKQNKKRIEEARKMQKELREKFIEINDFMNECEQKEKAVEKKIATEKEINEKLKKEIEEIDEKIKDLTEFHEEELKPAIEKGRVFEDVLQEVVDEMDIFKSKEDFLDRCEALCELGD